MPLKPKMRCTIRTCTNWRAEDSRYCLPHKQEEARNYNQFKRNKAAVQHYQSEAHRRWRQAVIGRDIFCQDCAKHNVWIQAIVADHIIPIEDGGDPFDLKNGQGLCLSCHNKKDKNWVKRR